jgi:hypothetical protein
MKANDIEVRHSNGSFAPEPAIPEWVPVQAILEARSAKGNQNC